jgi:DNA-binding response OmpR family regulator
MGMDGVGTLPRVLVIDDEIDLLNMLQAGLELQGFEVATASDGQEGLRQAYQGHPDAIVLDIMMDEMDGWTTCQRLRLMTDVPVIILSGRTSQADLIKGLSLGADDYVTKPFGVRELAARIHARLRRGRHAVWAEDADTYDDGYLRVDFRDGSVRKNGALIGLTPIESRLLVRLAQERGRIVSHRELLLGVWGPAYLNARNNLNVFIRNLRRKIEDDPNDPRYIRTRWKLGYYFSGSERAA